MTDFTTISSEELARLKMCEAENQNLKAMLESGLKECSKECMHKCVNYMGVRADVALLETELARLKERYEAEAITQGERYTELWNENQALIRERSGIIETHRDNIKRMGKQMEELLAAHDAAIWNEAAGVCGDIAKKVRAQVEEAGKGYVLKTVEVIEEELKARAKEIRNET